MSGKKFQERCSNPFSKKSHSTKVNRTNLRRVSGSLIEKFDSLKPEDLVCAPCKKIYAKWMSMKDVSGLKHNFFSIY